MTGSFAVFCSPSRREHVREQAILVVVGRPCKHTERRDLRTGVAVRCCLADAVPWRRRLRRRPSQVCDRWRGIGNAEEFGHIVLRQNPEPGRSVSPRPVPVQPGPVNACSEAASAGGHDPDTEMSHLSDEGVCRSWAERSLEGEFSRPRKRADFRCHCIVDSPLSLTSWFGPMRNLYQAFNKRNLNQRTPETVIAGRERQQG